MGRLSKIGRITMSLKRLLIATTPAIGSAVLALGLGYIGVRAEDGGNVGTYFYGTFFGAMGMLWALTIFRAVSPKRWGRASQGGD